MRVSEKRSINVNVQKANSGVATHLVGKRKLKPRNSQLKPMLKIGLFPTDHWRFGT